MLVEQLVGIEVLCERVGDFGIGQHIPYAETLALHAGGVMTLDGQVLGQILPLIVSPPSPIPCGPRVFVSLAAGFGAQERATGL